MSCCPRPTTRDASLFQHLRPLKGMKSTIPYPISVPARTHFSRLRLIYRRPNICLKPCLGVNPSPIFLSLGIIEYPFIVVDKGRFSIARVNRFPHVKRKIVAGELAIPDSFCCYLFCYHSKTLTLMGPFLKAD